MSRKHGFSLLELALALMITGLVTVMVLRADQNQQASGGPDCVTATRTQLTTIQGAITRFARSNDRLPLPARRFVGTQSPNYGREATIDQLTQTADGSVTSGALPWQALGIPSSYAGDCWGNKFSYIVTTNLTTKQTPAYGGHDGVIARKNAANLTIDDKIAYAVISHGTDALGAVKTSYDDANATTPDRKWCTGATIAHTNCLGNVAIVMDAPYNDGKAGNATYFDDLIVAGGKPHMLGCAVPWGGKIEHGQSVTAYQNASPPCISETRTCNGGALSGSFTNQACAGAINGVCNTSCNTIMACGGGSYSCDTGGCTVGTMSNYNLQKVKISGVIYPTSSTWQCDGINGGGSAACVSSFPTPGAESTCPVPLDII